MELQLTSDMTVKQRIKLWSRRVAIGFCGASSLLGWAAVAGLFVGVWSNDAPQNVADFNSKTLVDIAPASGSENSHQKKH
jgi:hypothetical protein